MDRTNTARSEPGTSMFSRYRPSPRRNRGSSVRSAGMPNVEGGTVTADMVPQPTGRTPLGKESDANDPSPHHGDLPPAGGHARRTGGGVSPNVGGDDLEARRGLASCQDRVERPGGVHVRSRWQDLVSGAGNRRGPHP